VNVRVAVLGSGPAGFYAAGQLLDAKDAEIEVDMYERLPTPWGLVRLGVAPDHPKIKGVSRIFEKTAAKPGFRFFGNVEVGGDVEIDDLRRHYHAIVYAVGSAADRQLGIPGEDLPGSRSSTEFVAWYNGHPDYCDAEFDLSAERAVVVGNGNVALDLARMLTLPEASLRQTDVADHALDVLLESKVREVVVLGRRGPAQASFTTPELAELFDLTDADVVVDPDDWEHDELATRMLDEAEGPALRKMEVLRRYSTAEPEGRPRQISLRFMRSPVELLGDDRVEAVRVVRNRLEEGDGGRVRAVPDGEEETIPAGLVFRAAGYKGVRLAGVPFDEDLCTIPHERGCVLEEPGGPKRPGEYATGWIKRGPSGVIGTNKKDSQETVDSLLEDLEAGRLPEPAEPEPDAVEALLDRAAPEHVTYQGWEAIDAAEREAGEPHGRPRIKLVRREDLLDQALGSVRTR
jgi:ferredoxin--NADP+ reductase